jgi:mono/diheme cytochrome c family protein/plastocyanin
MFLMSLGSVVVCSGCKRATDSPKPPGSAQPHAPAMAVVTFSDFPVPPKPGSATGLLEHGKIVYEQNCVACHGLKGDGNGPAAAFLAPKPRNFVEAKFRLRSTLIGQLPTDVDLFRSVSLGMPGTPMPPWKHILNDEDRWAVVEYIKSFSPRFADTNELRTVINTGTPTLRNEATVGDGKALFAKMGCIACHGDSGHGDGPSAATLVDDSQNRIKPRDFSRPSAFKSGYSTKEIARTILTGFNGTPMPGFHGAVSDADAWKIAYYVATFVKPAPSGPLVRASQNFLVREDLGEPDVKIRLRERVWKYDPDMIRVKKGQIVEINFEPTDNGLGVGHGFAISGYDEAVFLNGAMVGAPKTVKFRADRAGKFTFYCATQCSTEKLHPTMNGTLIVEDTPQKETASTK